MFIPCNCKSYCGVCTAVLAACATAAGYTCSRAYPFLSQLVGRWCLSALKCQQIAETNELSNLKRFRYAAAIFSCIPTSEQCPPSPPRTPGHTPASWHCPARNCTSPCLLQLRMHKENTRRKFVEPKQAAAQKKRIIQFISAL